MKKNKISQIVSFKYSSFRSKVGIFKSKLVLFWNFIRTAKYNQYLQWKFDEDKTLLQKGSESFIDHLVAYGVIGLLIAYAAFTFIKTPFTIQYIVSYGIAYWLLKKLLLMIRIGKE